MKGMQRMPGEMNWIILYAAKNVGLYMRRGL